MNIVYITENLITGKKYVGSHTTDDLNDNYLGSGQVLKLSIKKYGKENFKRTILKECETVLESRNLEEYYIKEYNTLTPDGYNISPKGGTLFGLSCHSEETKKKIGLKSKKRLESQEERDKMSLRFKDKSYEELYGIEKSSELKIKRKQVFDINNPIKGKKKEDNPNFGSKRSEETKKKISNSNKDKPKSEEHKKSLSKAWEKRKIEHPHTKETLEKMRKSMLGKNAKNTYKLTDKDGNEFITNNLTQFSKDNNLQQSLLFKVASGNRTHHRGWKCEKINK